jgi:phenylacetate-CoA ligase
MLAASCVPRWTWPAVPREDAMDDRTPDPADLEPIERASADELHAVQLDRLGWSLRHAYSRVPHYRAAFGQVGAEPGDIKELADLAGLPLLAKADLRDNYPFGMFAVPREQVARIHASSGTTGRPTVVGSTRRDLATWAALMARSLRAAGVRPGDRVHNAYGYGLFTGGLGAHYGAEELGCTVIPVSGGMTERQVTLIRDFEPDAITVTPSYMLAIAEEMERIGLDPAASSLRVGVIAAEPWTNDMRTELESRLGLHAVDIYGLSEVMGPGVAMECVETKDGLHVWEDHFLPEIIDPVSGAVLPDGELGELVITSLSREAMPVIRYRTRDLTRLLPGTARPMRRIEKIKGRSDDMIILRGVNLYPTQIEELILRVPRLSPHFQCVLRRPGALDELTVAVERRPGTGHTAAVAAGGELQRLIKATIGVRLSGPRARCGGLSTSADHRRALTVSVLWQKCTWDGSAEWIRCSESRQEVTSAACPGGSLASPGSAYSHGV